MSTFRRRIFMMAANAISYVSAWFRDEGFFRSDAW